MKCSPLPNHTSGRTVSAEPEAPRRGLRRSSGRGPKKRCSRNNRRVRAKGYAKWELRPNTQMLVNQVQEVLSEARQYLPLTARQVFYRLASQDGRGASGKRGVLGRATD